MTRAAASIQPAILIVEDEPHLREELAEMFEMRGFSVAEAGDVCSALRWLRAATRSTSVLTDFRMPGASGLDLVRTIRADRELVQRVPLIVLMTGHSDLTDQVDVELLRHNVRLLAKPVASDMLLSIFNGRVLAPFETGMAAC